jgi:hypothetical protein
MTVERYAARRKSKQCDGLARRDGHLAASSVSLESSRPFFSPQTQSPAEGGSSPLPSFGCMVAYQYYS